MITFKVYWIFLYINIVGNKNLIGYQVPQRSYGINWCLAKQSNDDNNREITKFNNLSKQLMYGNIPEVDLFIKTEEIPQHIKIVKEISMYEEFNLNYPFQNPNYIVNQRNYTSRDLNVLTERLAKNKVLYSLNKAAYDFAISEIKNQFFIETCLFDKLEINHKNDKEIHLLLINYEDSRFYVVKIKNNNNQFELLEPILVR